MQLNPYAQALAKLGAGKKKTMTPAAIRQRRQAAKSHKALAAKRRKEPK